MQVSMAEKVPHAASGLPRQRIVRGVLWALVLAALDQLIKAAMIDWLGPDQDSHRWELAGKYLAFHYIENTGAAFSMFAGRTALLTVLGAVVAVGVFATFRKELAHSWKLQIAMMLILAGAIGNLTDRIVRGYVVDFMAVGIWPKFNFADVYITLALALLAWVSFESVPSEAADHQPAKD
jgi:signal peptidase II